MVFTIMRASDLFIREKPCQNAEPIQALIQSRTWARGKRWRHGPGQFYIVRLESLDDLAKLLDEVGPIVVHESPNEAIPGSVGDTAPWKEAARGLDGEPMEILTGAHSIIVYDDFLE